MLHRRRKRLEGLAAKEAAGESFWTESFDEAVRTKIVLLIRRISGSYYGGDRFLELARELILTDEGMFFLNNRSAAAVLDFVGYVLAAPDEMMPTVVEALSAAFGSNQLRSDMGAWEAKPTFDAGIEVILREHRISYELLDSRMIEFSSRALHVGVISPALTLLAGDAKWAKVETAFQDALGELSDGKPGDAITDAGTALQEALTSLGCEGNALGPLIKSAKAKGLLAPHDAPMLDAIDRLMNWVSADRSEMGDAHTSAAPSVDDAWLTVHVVGALLLRLTKGQRS